MAKNQNELTAALLPIIVKMGDNVGYLYSKMMELCDTGARLQANILTISAECTTKVACAISGDVEIAKTASRNPSRDHSGAPS